MAGFAGNRYLMMRSGDAIIDRDLADAQSCSARGAGGTDGDGNGSRRDVDADPADAARQSAGRAGSPGGSGARYAGKGARRWVSAALPSLELARKAENRDAYRAIALTVGSRSDEIIGTVKQLPTDPIARAFFGRLIDEALGDSHH
jgi:hypothetical protein